MFSNKLIEIVKSVKKVAVLTGAGVSAESGVPTFRGKEGLWKKFRSEELANFNAFIKNPQLVWEWYQYRRKLISEVKPNPGHYALVKMERFYPEFTLITQNVDNLHRQSGSRNICELHGNIMRNKCVDCNKYITNIELTHENAVPHCECGGLIRPDVVWYGEMLPIEALEKSSRAAKECELFFSIGTSALVQPAASLPLLAKGAGAYVVEINYDPTVLSDLVDESILGKSGEILPQLVKLLYPNNNNQK